MKTYCINCINFFDGTRPKDSADGTYGDWDLCKAKEAPVNDFVRMRALPSLINTLGMCPYYIEKPIVNIPINKEEISE